MTAPDVEIRRAWRALAGAGHDDIVDGLLARHREPHRRYHTATHVMWVLRHVHRLLPGLAVPDAAALDLAALFHDAVHAPRADDNEERSAELAARAAVRLGWDPRRTQLVAALVLATAAHTPVDPDLDPATAVLVDADLAVLGAEPAAYAAYVAGVRSEYAHVDDAAWRVGRSAVLRRFLDRPVVFATEQMRAERERRARANLAAELATLRD